MSKDDNVDIENIESLKVMVIGDAAVGKTCTFVVCLLKNKRHAHFLFIQ